MNENNVSISELPKKRKLIKRQDNNSSLAIDLDDLDEDNSFNDLNDFNPNDFDEPNDFNDDIQFLESNTYDDLDTLTSDDLNSQPKKVKKVIKSLVKPKKPLNEVTESKATIEYGSFTAKLSKENITYAKILKATDQIKDISNFIDNLITEHRNTQNTNN